MRLTLSSSAAPDASLEELAAACVRKGLQGLELVVGEGHDVRPTHPPPTTGPAGVTITGLRLADATALRNLASPCGPHGPTVPVLVPVTTASELPAVLRAAGDFASAGGRVAVASADATLLGSASRTDPSVDVGWDFVPGSADPADLERLLDAAGTRLTHVRLFGGGPESVSQGGTGVGTLVAGLARLGFSGALVITPSSPRYRVAWSAWLGRRGGWGCSGKATPSEPIALQRSPV